MLQVTVPPGVGPGMQMEVNGPNGPMLVTVPAGMGPGSVLLVQAPPIAMGQVVYDEKQAFAQGVPQHSGYAYPPGVTQGVPQPYSSGFAPGSGGSQDFLGTMDGVFVRQQLELLELLSGCETKNRYNIVAVPTGTRFPPPGSMHSGFTAGLREQSNLMPLLKAKEQSECFERICCPLFRGLQLPMKDGADTVFLTLDRPCVFDPCYAPPACACIGQQLDVRNGQGNAVAKVKMQPGCCTAGLCAGYFHITKPDGTRMYSLRASDCNTHSGCCSNFCAPTCLNEAYDIDVYGPDMEYINTSTFVWPGCNCGGLTDLSNFIVQFPQGSTPDQRAALLGAMFLVEFTVNEARRQNNNNNNSGFSGGGPVAPQEMER